MMFLLISVPVRGFDIFVRLIHLKFVVWVVWHWIFLPFIYHQSHANPGSNPNPLGQKPIL